MRALILTLAQVAALVANAAPVATRWDGKLAQAKGLIVAKHFAAAQPLCDEVVAAALASPAPEAEVRAALAAATACRAVAYRRTMQASRGEWEWQIAVNLSPEVATRWRDDLPDLQALPSAETLSQPPADIERLGRNRAVQAPVAVVMPKPAYPHRSRMRRIQTDVVVEFTVDTSGRVSRPRIRSENVDAALAYAALDAVRDAKFAPATVDGRAIAVLFNLTIHFKLEDPTPVPDGATQ